MKVRFVGAVGTVTGSCSWLKYDRSNLQFLVDCGMYQGEGDAERRNTAKFPFEASELDFVLLTHAHMDHCGLIPRLYKEGFSGKVYCTTATAELSKLMLEDASRQDNCPYTRHDVKSIRFECVDEWRNFGWSRWMPIADGLFVQFLRTTHILGAASIGISWKAENDDFKDNPSIIFSGDLGNNTDNNCYRPLLADCQRPYETANYIVLESTYGSRSREKDFCSFDEAVSKLREVLAEAIWDRGGNVVIAAFSMHRTQELVITLARALENGPFDALGPGQRVWPAQKVDRLLAGVKSGTFSKLIIENPFLNAGRVRDLCNQFELADSVTPVTPESVAALTSAKDGTLIQPKSGLTPEERESLRKDLSAVPFQIVLNVQVDSALSIAITRIYGRELLRSLRQNADKYMYLSVDSAARQLGVTAEEVPREIERLLPSSEEVKEASIGRHHLNYATHKDREPRYDQARSIFVSSAGMCEGGPVLEHLREQLTSPTATFVLTGYQSAGTLGRELWHLANQTSEGSRIKTLEVAGDPIPIDSVKAKIVDLSPYFSGHADADRLIEYVFAAAPGDRPTDCTVFLNHGTDDSRSTLREALLARSNERREGERVLKDVLMPEADSGWFDLNLCKWIEEDAVEHPGAINDRTIGLLERLVVANERIADALEQIVKGHPD